jgi:hypothetical protein
VSLCSRRLFRTFGIAFVVSTFRSHDREVVIQISSSNYLFFMRHVGFPGPLTCLGDSCVPWLLAASVPPICTSPDLCEVVSSSLALRSSFTRNACVSGAFCWATGKPFGAEVVGVCSRDRCFVERGDPFLFDKFTGEVGVSDFVPRLRFFPLELSPDLSVGGGWGVWSGSGETAPSRAGSGGIGGPRRVEEAEGIEFFFGFFGALGFVSYGSPLAAAAARFSSSSLLLGRPRFFLCGSRISEGDS